MTDRELTRYYRRIMRSKLAKYFTPKSPELERAKEVVSKICRR